MRFLIGAFLIFGGICGMAISLLGQVIVSSQVLAINGLELSSGIGLFSIVSLLSGLYIIIFQGASA